MTFGVTKPTQRSKRIKPEIDVLLATFNGAKYLGELLNSLVSQQGVLINLIVSDDGSQDETLTIIGQYESKFHSLVILDGPKLGPAQNFFHLLRHSTSEFAAFADQDDIWSVDHLANSVQRLLAHVSGPALSFSAVTRSFESGQEPEIWPKLARIPDISQMFIECAALGCTMVLNKPAVNLVNSYRPERAIMHDRWCLLVMKTCGSVVFGSKPEITYRIHASNVSGLGKRSARETFRKVRRRSWLPYSQITELHNAFRESMTSDAQKEIEELIGALEGGLGKRIRTLVFTRRRFREELYNELRTRIAFLLFPLLFDTKKRSTQP